VPVVSPWRTKQGSSIEQTVWLLERNPYFWEVDTAGNQLPYLDEFFLVTSESMDVTNLRAIAGEYDFQYRDITMANTSAFLESAAKYGYRVYIDRALHGCDWCLYFNQSYDADPEVAKWIQTADFRRALSLGIDRDQFNEVFWQGLGIPGSAVVAEVSPENPGPEYRDMWSTYDPDKANEMLDALGLDQKDANGCRLRTDNGEPLVIDVTAKADPPTDAQRIEMLQEQWKQIGICIQIPVVDYDRFGELTTENLNPINQYTSWGTEALFLNLETTGRNLSFTTRGSEIGPEFGVYYRTNGAEGRKPEDPLILQMWDLFTEGRTLGPGPERDAIAQEMWKIVIDQQWTVGVVGQIPFWPRLANIELGNMPEGVCFSAHCRFPGTARAETFFWKR